VGVGILRAILFRFRSRPRRTCASFTGGKATIGLVLPLAFIIAIARDTNWSRSDQSYFRDHPLAKAHKPRRTYSLIALASSFPIRFSPPLVGPDRQYCMRSGQERADGFRIEGEPKLTFEVERPWRFPLVCLAFEDRRPSNCPTTAPENSFNPLARLNGISRHIYGSELRPCLRLTGWAPMRPRSYAPYSSFRCGEARLFLS